MHLWAHENSLVVCRGRACTSILQGLQMMNSLFMLAYTSDSRIKELSWSIVQFMKLLDKPDKHHFSLFYLSINSMQTYHTCYGTSLMPLFFSMIFTIYSLTQSDIHNLFSQMLSQCFPTAQSWDSNIFIPKAWPTVCSSRWATQSSCTSSSRAVAAHSVKTWIQQYLGNPGQLNSFQGIR